MKKNYQEIFKEYEVAEKEMKEINDEVKRLCQIGEYDNAQTIVDERLEKVTERWRNALRDFLSYMRK